jgi:hypothetical protein
MDRKKSITFINQLPTVNKSILHSYSNWTKQCRLIQQQQQHSLLSQASWGRLEMKLKRDDKQGDTQRDIKDTRQEEVTVQAR